MIFITQSYVYLEIEQSRQSESRDDWTASILTGVDWKSLCIPACLPLTIRYFPDEAILRKEYFEYNYTMIIEDGPASGRLISDR